MKPEEQEKQFKKLFAGPKKVPELVTSQDGYDTMTNITTSAKKINQGKNAKG